MRGVTDILKLLSFAHLSHPEYWDGINSLHKSPCSAFPPKILGLLSYYWMDRRVRLQSCIDGKEGMQRKETEERNWWEKGSVEGKRKIGGKKEKMEQKKLHLGWGGGRERKDARGTKTTKNRDALKSDVGMGEENYKMKWGWRGGCGEKRENKRPDEREKEGNRNQEDVFVRIRCLEHLEWLSKTSLAFRNWMCADRGEDGGLLI